MNWLFAIAAAAILYAAVRRLKCERPSPAGRDAMPATRSQRSGDEGEAVVQAELREALRWLCGSNFYLHQGALLLNHAPGNEFPTAEVDHLAITPFGIFVIETKHWTGRIEPGPDAHTSVRVGIDGLREVRCSPVRQNRSKVAFLRSSLPGAWSVEGLAVFSNQHCEIAPSFPVNLMKLGDLRQWLRARKACHEARSLLPINVQHAQRAVLAVSETRADAIESHRSKVREYPKKLPILT